MSGSVHIVTRLNVGGIARFLEIGADGVDTLLRGRVEGGETEATWDREQRTCTDLRRSVAPIRDSRALRWITRELERLRPDVVHTHASKAGVLGRIAARRLGIPCVHTFHGHVLSGYFGRLGSAHALRSAAAQPSDSSRGPDVKAPPARPNRQDPTGEPRGGMGRPRIDTWS